MVVLVTNKESKFCLKTLSRKAADVRVIFWQWFLFFLEISGFEQTLLVTDITATLIRKAMSKASALSSKKNLLALCIHICNSQ